MKLIDGGTFQMLEWLFVDIFGKGFIKELLFVRG
jgi:hypothetical protein